MFLCRNNKNYPLLSPNIHSYLELCPMSRLDQTNHTDSAFFMSKDPCYWTGILLHVEPFCYASIISFDKALFQQLQSDCRISQSITNQPAVCNSSVREEYITAVCQYTVNLASV